MFKGTKIYSILFNRCPRCHKGKFFRTDNPYNFSKFASMHPSCPVCGENYFPEPGFYYGAMFTSYILNVAWFGVLLVTTFAFQTDDMELYWYFLWITVPLLILVPFTFRLSRLVWLNIFVTFDEELAKTKIGNHNG